MNVSQNQELLDEGIAREVVNCIQKLRKKAGLVPVDDVQVYYKVTPATSELNQVIQNFTEYIGHSIKKPFAPYPFPVELAVVVGESQTLKGATEATLHISIVEFVILPANFIP